MLDCFVLFRKVGLRLAVMFLLSGVLVAQEVEEPVGDEPVVENAAPVLADEEEMSTGEAFLRKLKEGGGTMLFLLACSVVAGGCAVERFARQRKKFIAPEGLAERVGDLWAKGDHAVLADELAEDKSTLAKMFAAISRYRESGVERVSVISGDIASRDLKRHLQAAFPLAVVATIAPLLGLFGTVIGMIGAFDKIALLGELANPSAFGGDIGKALITTGAGLAVAIASLALYHWFKSRISVYALELEELTSERLVEWFDQGRGGVNPKVEGSAGDAH